MSNQRKKQEIFMEKYITESFEENKFMLQLFDNLCHTGNRNLIPVIYSAYKGLAI
jgi:hypothetical protein